ncbi:hypothetical protein MKX68_12570 [Paenibacillus sp. FSL M8-0212]|uniref:hypothetical protein n=1 Tax=Paenibacillus sp. FSL M8-0212 TaxID=2921618 RepID=UPI0030F76DE5
MSNFVSDEIYHTISQEVYRDSIQSGYNFPTNTDWKVIKPSGMLDDEKSGFHAEVFYNKKTDQVIIGYRGTEPPDRPIKSVITDYGTDLKDVIGGRTKYTEQQWTSVHNNPNLNEAEKKLISPQVYGPNSQYENNQFYQADQLYISVRKEYPQAEISTTGHSLGGALAQYVSVRNNLSSTTYNPASIRAVVSDDILKKIDAGEYDKKNTAYVNPGDGVGAGFFNSSTRHAANTIMINKTYEEANNRYVQITIPIISKSSGTSSGISTPFWKNITFVSTTLPIGTQGMGEKLFNSFGGEKAHGLENFKFDKNGFITNTLYTRDGEVIGGNPRYTEYINILLANEKMKDTVNKLIEKYGAHLGPLGQMAAAGAGVTIQLSLENLQRAGQKMQQHVNEFQSSLPTATNAILRLIESSDSRSLEPIVDRLTSDLHKFSRWYEEEAHIIAEYINQKAEDFRQADEG